jgi:hypothetical protein
MNNPHQDEPGTEPARQTSNDGPSSPKGPLYSDVSESKRVQLAIFRHDQPNGEARYTTSISRRYKRKDGEWITSSFFDHPRDLEDVLTFANEAIAKINRYKGIQQSGDLTPDQP